VDACGARLVAALSHGADYARGSRYADPGGRGVPRAWTGSRWIHRTAGVLRGAGIIDTWCGCTALWARCLDRLDLDRLLERRVDGERWGNRLDIEALIHRRMVGAGMRIAEVPVRACPELPGDNRRHA
jgi:hypothetical protein